MTFINIWLLFNLLFPFTIVLLHSWIQYQRARMTKVGRPVKFGKFLKLGSFFKLGTFVKVGSPVKEKKGGGIRWPDAHTMVTVGAFVTKVNVRKT